MNSGDHKGPVDPQVEAKASGLKRLYRRLPLGVRGTVARVVGSMRRFVDPRLVARDRWVRIEYMGYGMRAREEVFLAIARFAHINRPIKGYYFEFGCHEANTMRMAWRHFRYLFDWTFVALALFASHVDA